MNFRSSVAAALMFCLLHCVAHAEEGQPIAIRHWPGGGFTVETMWGLSVGFGLSDDAKTKLPRKLDFDSSTAEPYSMWLVNRPPNESEVKTSPLTDHDFPKNAVRVFLKANGGLVDHENLSAHVGWPSLRTGNASVWFLNELDPEKTCKRLELARSHGLGSGDFELKDHELNVVVANDSRFTSEHCRRIIDACKPEILVVNSEIKKVGEQDVLAVSHNTLAVLDSAGLGKPTRIVSLETTPYEMSDELADLFAKKEASQKASREMFAKLSVEQMNFKPANGTHTPRWNTEHMMGRELLFFSQIYNAVDPSIPVMDLNPKQMPKDYKFAHEDWTGEEEARQMKRVEDFTRRFAYLLDGMDLDKKAKGSRFWTPRKLLAQMERHYNEHSANVVKKMELEGWPKY
ncbi:DinB family protein [Mariniblastus fucicola]|uniref:DinB superfamily protein n=1 Tax=Mariniblastus fucicola TaxID=980251 RepID=A0A5B9P8R2_9BACT|nr:DinB family protein [Mariniblastus fucicola]QEG21829.1 hypothetical protein MFFC18_16890 [Mariniblastus fucicola]